MYKYDNYDQTIVNERAEQFRDQIRRFLAGELSNDEFLPLRVMNGLYIQTHGPMLRVAIPYGLLSSKQLRMLAHIARKYDKGFGHFSTRQNIQFHWVNLEEVPDILVDLASVEMHAIQTSGNDIRNTTSDQFAGIAEDELEDPRPYCEIIRQWSTLHPEFSYLPRKFKIAISGAKHDRAAVMVHDVGLYLIKNDAGEIGFNVTVGGGLGRTPFIGSTIKPFLQKQDLLSYLEAILRVYNCNGRRDNMLKARIKFLVNDLGIEEFARQVEEEWLLIKDSVLKLDQKEIDRVKAFFTSPDYDKNAVDDTSFTAALESNKDFANWAKRNLFSHKVAGYKAVVISLKASGDTPGDASDDQMDHIAELADHFSFGEVVVTHDQNMVLPNVKQADLLPLWEKLLEQNLATPNIGMLTDMICCPGQDFCALAKTSTIPIAKQINEKFDDMDFLHDIGDIKIKMSGCMNACGHHHVGHIGIIGIDKKGKEFYQLTLGGSAENDACLGDRLGRGIAKKEVANVIGKLLDVYVELRQEGERFIDTYRRVGLTPFKKRVYPKTVTREKVYASN